MSRSILLLAVLACLALAALPLITAHSPRHSSLQSLLPAASPSTDESILRASLPAALRDTHVLNNITVGSGSWTGTISVLYEYLTFTDATGATIQSFPVTAASPYSFGLVLQSNTDFDAMYQITLVEGGGVSKVDKRVCLFVISAYSAGHPQVATLAFNGKVNCSYTNNGFVQSYQAM